MKKFMSKVLNPKWIAAIVIAGCAMIGAGNLTRTQAVAVNGSNDIISAGASSASDLINKIKIDSSSGTYGGDLATIYAYKNYKLPASEYNNFLNYAKSGVIYQDGHITVDGQTVATNAITLSRNTTNPTNHTPLVIGGKTYSEVSVTHTMTSTQLDTMVLFDDKGNLQTAIINKCGNPLRVTPVNPSYNCDMLNATPAVTSGYNDTYNFTSNITANTGATVTKVVYDFGDGQTSGPIASPSTVVPHKYAPGKTYTAKVTAYINTTFGRGEFPITVTANCQKTFTIAEAPNPAVTITKSVTNEGNNNSVVALNTDFPYIIKVTNTGSVDLVNMTIKDQAPAGVVFKSTNKGTIVNNALQLTGQTLAKGQSVTVTITAQLTQYTDQTVTNRACVETPTVPATANEGLCDTANITTPTPKTPHVSITKTVGPNNQETLEVAKDGTFSYTVTAKNDGEVALTNVVISDTAPTGIQFVSAKAGTTDVPVTGSKVSYTAPTLAVGQSVTIVITAKSTAVATTAVVNKACVTATTPATTNPCDTASTTTPEVPTPKQVDVCDASTGNIIRVDEANASKYDDVNSDKCKVSVCDATDGTIKLVPKADASKYESKDSDKCKVQVCDSSDHIVKFVPKADASKYLPGDSNACVKIEVCVIKSGDTAMKSIYKDQLDTTKQSTKASDCVKPETPVTPVTQAVAPAAIASTGPEAILGGISSASALTYGAYTYAASRRAVRNAHK